MPPVLDPSKSKVDGLVFLGISLARKNDSVGHPESNTYQTSFDFNEVQDRDYKYIFSTNDDGWLVGGGEPGVPKSYKLPAPDSAHVEIMRIGTYHKKWGGIPVEEIVQAFQQAKILIPEITVVPTAVCENDDLPPELEIRFDMERAPSQHKWNRMNYYHPYHIIGNYVLYRINYSVCFIIQVDSIQDPSIPRLYGK